MVKHISKEDFQKNVIESPLPVVVDFYAAWCGPCQTIAPVIDELNNELKDKAKVYKVDVDKEHKLASQYGVMSIPTVLIFKFGKVVCQFTSAVKKKEIIKGLE